MQHCKNVSCWELSEDVRRLKQESKTGLKDWHDLLEGIPENLPRACKKDIKKSVELIIRDLPTESFHLKEWIEAHENFREPGIKKLIKSKLDSVVVTDENKDQFLDLGKMAQRMMRHALEARPEIGRH